MFPGALELVCAVVACTSFGSPLYAICPPSTSETKGEEIVAFSLQAPILYRSCCLGSKLIRPSVSLLVEIFFGVTFSGGLFGSAAVHCGPRFPAITKQFPARSPNGVGNLIVSYGPKQSDKPRPFEVVLVRYALNCDVLPPKIPPAPEGHTGRSGRNAQSVGKAKIGSPAKSGKILVISGALGLHQKI